MRIVWAVVGVALMGCTQSQAPGVPTVTVIYLVPSDKAVNPDYVEALSSAVQKVQGWYQGQMGSGLTFLLPASAVLTLQTNHPSEWYSETLNGSPEESFWDNGVSDGLSLIDTMGDVKNRIWMFYIDAEPGCGEVIGGTKGVALLEGNDLRGLVGQSQEYSCNAPIVTSGGACPFIGRMGHELGHTFGLPHPAGCDEGLASCDYSDLMWTGLYDYPNTVLASDEKQQVAGSGDLAPIGATDESNCESLSAGSNGTSGPNPVPVLSSRREPPDVFLSR